MGADQRTERGSPEMTDQQDPKDEGTKAPLSTDEDTEGHRAALPRGATDSDDTEGHRADLPRGVAVEDDDTEGHRAALPRG
jgi:hypothetical protein